MTRERIIALAKEKLGKDITEQEAQDFLDGKLALPDEALDIVSGGTDCQTTCPACGASNVYYSFKFEKIYCGNCAYTFSNSELSKRG